MTTHKLHTITLALLAALSLAGSAHATNNDMPSSDGAGRGCDDNGSYMPDGGWKTYGNRNQRGSVTCTNGTICHTWKVRQRGNRWAWFDECYESPSNSATLRESGAPPSDATVAPARSG